MDKPYFIKDLMNVSLPRSGHNSHYPIEILLIYPVCEGTITNPPTLDTWIGLSVSTRAVLVPQVTF